MNLIDLSELRKITELLKIISIESVEDPEVLKRRLNVDDDELEDLMNKANLIVDLVSGSYSNN